jgi:hypothetical protein
LEIPLEALSISLGVGGNLFIEIIASFCVKMAHMNRQWKNDVAELY